MEIKNLMGKRTYLLYEYNEQLIRKLIRKINVSYAFQRKIIFQIWLVV